MGSREENVEFVLPKMCLSLYDYQSKASRYRKGLTYLKNRVITNQKHRTDSQKPKRREHKYNINTKENHQNTHTHRHTHRHTYRDTQGMLGLSG